MTATTKTTNECSDFMHFFRAWIANPLRVAAVAPSGESLARLMTREITSEHGPILELGPGTGVFTRALLARGVSESQLTLVEYGRDFLPMLQSGFPEARILSMDAAKLGHLSIFVDEPAGAVVSGLPLLSMPPRKITSILSGAFKHIRQGGAFYQFTLAGPFARCRGPSSTGSASRRRASGARCATFRRRRSIASPGVRTWPGLLRTARRAAVAAH